MNTFTEIHICWLAARVGSHGSEQGAVLGTHEAGGKHAGQRDKTERSDTCFHKLGAGGSEHGKKREAGLKESSGVRRAREVFVVASASDDFLPCWTV
jgi:hypothetical protein